jgi:hypothetical protein
MIDALFTTYPSPGAIEVRRPTCHEPPMRGRHGKAAGSMLAISILAGAVAGVIVGQPSLGVLAGTAAGVVIAILFWLKERRG